MKTVSKIALTCVAAFSLSSVAYAQDKITKEEAQALVKKIVAFAKANGEEKAIAVCNTAEFHVKADGYISAFNPKGVNVCNKNEKMRGKDLIDMKDADGVSIVKEFLKVCNSAAGNGWVTYKWSNPLKAIENKGAYAEKQGSICWTSSYFL
jgi:cytochrome c